MIVYLDFKNGLNSKLSANFTNFRKFFAGGGGGGGGWGGGGGGGGVDLSAEKEVRTWLFKTKISAKS